LPIIVVKALPEIAVSTINALCILGKFKYSSANSSLPSTSFNKK
jgi:hypothetical protein